MNRENLASRKLQLSAISEFANMEDSPERWQAFQKRWPTLLPPGLFEDSSNELQQNAEWAKTPVVSDGPPTSYRLGTDHIGVGQFKPAEDGKWVEYRQPKVLHLRDLIREAWGGGTRANESMEELLGRRSPSGEMLDVWSPTVSADWRRGLLRFLPSNPFETACYALLQNSRLAKVCANPDCPAPYFIARRATQRYCSPDCLKPFQKQSKLDWWNRKGKLRRAKAAAKDDKRR